VDGPGLSLPSASTVLGATLRGGGAARRPLVVDVVMVMPPRIARSLDALARIVDDRGGAAPMHMTQSCRDLRHDSRMSRTYVCILLDCWVALVHGPGRRRRTRHRRDDPRPSVPRRCDAAVGAGQAPPAQVVG